MRLTTRVAAAMIAVLSRLLRLVPDHVPGKSRLGRWLLRPFFLVKPALLKDGQGCTYALPSYAEPIAQHLFTFGAYESDTVKFVLRFLSEEGVLVDVGANIGSIAIPVAKARPQASVLCIEADPDLHRLLLENVRTNGCTTVRTFCCLVGASDQGSVPFYRAPDEHFGMGSIGPQFGASPLYLRQARLDDLLAQAQIDLIDVIKIDVEGAELGVLRGAMRILGSHRPPVIVFEFADWAEARIFGQQPGDAQSFLLEQGYRLFRLKADGSPDDELTAPARHGTAMLMALPPSKFNSAMKAVEPTYGAVGVHELRHSKN